jgi:hypothetical protein
VFTRSIGSNPTGDRRNDFVEFTQGLVTRSFGNWGTRALYRTWIVAAGAEGGGSGAASSGGGGALGISGALAPRSPSSGGRLERFGGSAGEWASLTPTGQVLCRLYRAGGDWWNLLAGWHRDPSRAATQGPLLPVPLSDFPAATQFVLAHGSDLAPDDLAELVSPNARALYGTDAPSGGSRGGPSGASGGSGGGSGPGATGVLTCALRGGSGSPQLHETAQGEDGVDVACVRFDLLEYYLVHVVLHASRSDRAAGPAAGGAGHRRAVPLAGLQQVQDVELDVAGPWAVFHAHEAWASFQGLANYMDDLGGSGGGGGGSGGPLLNGRVDRLVQRSPYLTLLLDAATSLWAHRGNDWGGGGLGGGGGPGRSSSGGGGAGLGAGLGVEPGSGLGTWSLPDGRCAELLARLVGDLWLAGDHLPRHDGAEATGRAERRRARLEHAQAAARQSSAWGGGSGGLGAAAGAGAAGAAGSRGAKAGAWLPPAAPAAKHLPVVAAQAVLVCSAQLLADPDLHSACTRRPLHELFPACAGARTPASMPLLPPPSAELRRFVQQGAAMSPLELELEAQRRDENGDPAHADQARDAHHRCLGA